MSEKKNKTKSAKSLSTTRGSWAFKNAGTGCSTYLRHVRCDRSGADFDRIKCIHHPADGRFGNFAVPFDYQGQGAGIPRLLVCLSGRLFCGSTSPGRRSIQCGDVALCLRRCFGCGAGVCLDVRTDFSLWYSQNHALFPAGGHRSDHHFDWSDFGSDCNQQRQPELAACLHRAGGDCRLQHLGKRNGQNRSDSAGYSRFLCCGSVHGRGQL